LIAGIFLNILAPILLIIATGAILSWRFKLDLATLSKINIFIFAPAFVFDKVSTSTLSWSAMGGVVAISVLQVATLGVLIWLGGKALHINRATLAAIALAVMFYNSGNYGLPLAELAYPARGASGRSGGAVQAFVVMTQNVLGYTVGMVIAAMVGAKDKMTAVVKVFRVPVVYTLTAALLTRAWLNGHPDRHLPIAIAKPIEYLAAGLVPVALLTLGAQLATNPRWPRWKPVSVVLVLRLIFGPVQMAALLYLLHLTHMPAIDLWGKDGWPAQLLILTAAVPSAITTLLLTLELGGDAELAADCVFWTTVVSCVTILGWLIVIRTVFGG
jgi:predicted permease